MNACRVSPGDKKNRRSARRFVSSIRLQPSNTPTASQDNITHQNMRERNFRTRITQGVYTLPAAIVIGCLLWLTAGYDNITAWEGFGIVVVVTYLLAELNNRSTLLRIRSRMVSTSFVILMAATPFFYTWSVDMIPMLCLVAAYFPLFAAYGQARSAGYVFHAALCVGLGSLVYPPMLLLAPVLLFSLAVSLRALSGSSFLALLFGLLLPYWLLLGVGVWFDDVQTVFVPYIEAFQFQKPDYSALSLPQIVTMAYVTLLAFVAMIHFARVAYNDKIRTRMYFYVFILFELVIMGALAMQPQKSDVLLRLYIVNSTPLIAHHFTLGRGRWANIWFGLCLLLLIGVLAFNMGYGKLF